MRSLFIALALALAACGSADGAETVCGQACEKLQQCKIGRIHITSIKSYGFDADCGGVACDSITECISRCIKAADCPTLQNVVLDGPLHTCMVACNSWFQP